MTLKPFLDFVRRHRTKILQDCEDAQAFCLGLTAGQSAVPFVEDALKLLEPLPDDVQDYAVASAYALLIGSDRRKHLSAFFTPPALVATALEAAAPFLAMSNPRVLDPACGGGSFLGPLAHHLISAKISAGVARPTAVSDTIAGLKGIELDSGLAALSTALLNRMIRRAFGVSADAAVVQNADALTVSAEPTYDLVLGNPPYGRIGDRVAAGILARAGRANLGGHTNLYGLFLLQALDWLKPGGGLVFVLPTSFVAGPYFSGLRYELLQKARVLRIDAHVQRNDLFVDAVQDVCVLTLERRVEARTSETRDPFYEMGSVNAQGERRLLGRSEAHADGEPWMLPHVAPTTCEFSPAPDDVNRSPSVLTDYGYRIRVGKVVPTREANQLRKVPAPGALPLLWASTVRPDGTFEFSNGAHKKLASWYAPPAGSKLTYATERKAVLVQRTSNREQKRRLNAAVVPDAFYAEHAVEGFVAENHVIILEATDDAPAVAPAVLAALLNAPKTNERFSAVSGSFSVSAKLLSRLALPHASRLPTEGVANFDEAIAAAFDGIGGVLAPLIRAGDLENSVDKSSRLSSPSTIDEDAGLKGCAVS